MRMTIGMFRLLVVACLGCFAATAHAQVPQRLPGVFYPASETAPAFRNQADEEYVWIDSAPPYESRLVSRPAELQQPLGPEGVEQELTRIPQAKDGALQDVSLLATFVAPPDDDDLGFTDLSLGATVGLPAPSRDFPLLVTPFFQVKYLSGPDAPDLPARLFSTYMQFRWLPKLSELWRLDLAVSPGFYSDFETDDDDAFRLTGRGLAILTWSEQAMLVAGVLFLDRPDVGVLPAGGILWTPGDWRFEIIFPQPRIARRFAFFTDPALIEYWWYVKGEFGGDAWAIERTSGANDQIVIRDLRLILGLERKVHNRIGALVEVGYVFDREVEFARTLTPDFEPGDTVLVRGGLRY